ncbi:MAG: hypothetical protein ABW130_21065 [Candidatus Thiodiazotropha lotti]
MIQVWGTNTPASGLVGPAGALVDALIGLRVSKEEGIEGLDIVLHEERGYNEIS